MCLLSSQQVIFQCVMHIVTPRNRAPYVRKRAPDLRKRATDMRQRAPDIRKRVPYVRKRASDIRQRAPDVRERAPYVRKRALCVPFCVNKVHFPVCNEQRHTSQKRLYPKRALYLRFCISVHFSFMHT